MTKPRLLFYFACPLDQVTGAQFRLCGAIGLLQDSCDITLLVPGTPDWDDTNRKFGSQVKKEGIRVVPYKRPGDRWTKFRIWFACYGPLDPAVGKMAAQYDLCVSFDNFGYFGTPGIHIATNLSLLYSMGIRIPKYKMWRDPDTPLSSLVITGIKRGFVRSAHAVLTLFKIVMRRKKRFLKICGRNGDRIVANSNWLASFLKAEGYRPDILYPPVVAKFRHIPFEKRRNDFVCIGRIHEQKRLVTMIEILEKVRGITGIPFRFRIVAPLNDDPYCRYICKLAQSRPWIKLEGELYGAEKEEVLTSCKYAIHACLVETFGISVAEYLKAGCIPFVPAAAGPGEIVEIEELCFRDTEDAVKKITGVLGKSGAEQTALQARLLERGEAFSLDEFDNSLMSLIKEELEKRGFAGVPGRTF